MAEKERTLIIIKPDGVQRHLAGEIITRFEKKGFKIVAAKFMQISQELAGKHYAVHKGKPFYEELVEFMTSGPVIVLALEKENAINAWRDLMGATDPAEAADNTLRKLYGKSKGNNATHGSDSPENAKIELEFFAEELKTA